MSVQFWPAESVTVKLSVPFDDSRQKATSRSPALVVIGTEKEVNAAPLTSMLFWTCTNAGPAPPPPVEEVPVPVRLAVCGLLLALSLTVSVAVLVVPLTAGVNATLIAQLAAAAKLGGQLFVCAKSPGFVPVMPMLVMLSSAPPEFERVIV